MAASLRARSTTMVFATEPAIVRFPASLLDMASVNLTVCGFENRVTRDFKSITAGTLLTKFDNMAVAIVKTLKRCSRNAG